ncbi:MAG: hypothetical protein EA401_05005 [Planctomycetota bacterium]|nr:MAG: hypothetical protein EA401_05005 [Planctomycetota bacterium]
METDRTTDPLIKASSGQWLVESRMGTGHFSQVYRALHGESGKQAVLKILRTDLKDPREGERALAREEDVLSQCDHPGFPKFIKRLTIQNRKGILITHCDGHPVIKLLRQVPHFDRVGVIRSVARMLKHIHERGYVHGDVTLENILMAPGGRVYLTSFSQARREMRSGTEVITRVFRKPTYEGGQFIYLAPEIMGSKAINQCSDVFAFGVCAFLLLSRRKPYTIKNVAMYKKLAQEKAQADILRHHPRMPRPFASIINRCISMDPESRIPNGIEVSDSLDMFFAQKGNPQPSELSRMFAPPEKANDDKGEDIRWID